jgi:hypothetical protein
MLSGEQEMMLTGSVADAIALKLKEEHSLSVYGGMYGDITFYEEGIRIFKLDLFLSYVKTEFNIAYFDCSHGRGLFVCKIKYNLVTNEIFEYEPILGVVEEWKSHFPILIKLSKHFYSFAAFGGIKKTLRAFDDLYERLRVNDCGIDIQYNLSPKSFDIKTEYHISFVQAENSLSIIIGNIEYWRLDCVYMSREQFTKDLFDILVPQSYIREQKLKHITYEN